MFISTVVSRVLQSLEFVRFNIGSYFVGFWRASLLGRIFMIGAFIWGCIRFTISLYGTMLHAIADAWASRNVNALAIQSGGTDILAMANSILPLDEIIALLVSWCSLNAVCAFIRFIRAAWAAIPLKAT